MNKPMTLEALSDKLSLGTITKVDTSDFVEFGDIVTVYAGKATSYPDTLVFLYRVVPEWGNIFNDKPDTYIARIPAKPLF